MARILIVEDMPTEAELLTVLCESLGHQVEVAADGEDALKLLEGDNFQLIMVDIAMPVMDGYELIRQLRLAPRHADLPIVVLTAWNLTTLGPALAGLGVAEVIHKPYDARTIRARLLYFLG